MAWPIALARSTTSLMSELSPADFVEANRLSSPEDFRPISSRVEMIRARSSRSRLPLSVGRHFQASSLIAGKNPVNLTPLLAFRGGGVGPVRDSTEVGLELSKQGVPARVTLLYTSVGGGTWTPPTCGTFESVAPVGQTMYCD